MKILKLSLLTRIVNSAKDAKKYIFYINIGIFLSIFAISAASISFYIENKIDRIEFDLIQYQYDEKDNQNTLKELSVFNNIVQANLTSSKKIQNLYEHIASMGLGEYTISPEDIYLPSVYVQMTSNDNQNFIEMIEDGSFDAILKLFKELPINQEWKKTTGEESINVSRFERSINEIKNSTLFKEDFTNLHKNIFNYDFFKIENQIFNKSININDYDSQYYKDYLKLLNFHNDLIIILGVMNEYFEYLSLKNKENISALNESIVYYSRIESQIIIFTFLFQFIIFTIIQFFEISSLQPGNIKNAKRKTR